MMATFNNKNETEVTCMSAWREGVSLNFEQLKVIEVKKTENFRSTMAVQGSGPARTARLSSAPQRVQRGEDGCEEAKLICVLLIVSGDTLLTQNGIDVNLSSGDLVLFDNTRPYTLEMLDNFDHSMLLCSRASYTEKLSLMALQNPVKISNSPSARLLQQLVHCAANTPDRMNDNEISHTALAALHLCAAAIGPGAREDIARDRVSQALFARICSDIRASISDPQLSPTSIAQAHQISVRYLHKLFAQRGLQVMRFVRDERLAGCHRELSEALTRPNLAALACRWGFEDDSSFRRAFRKSYGYAPSQAFKK